MQGRRIEVSLEALDFGQLWHRDLRELLEVFFQCNRVVILGVFSGEEQCDSGFSGKPLAFYFIMTVYVQPRSVRPQGLVLRRR